MGVAHAPSSRRKRTRRAALALLALVAVVLLARTRRRAIVRDGVTVWPGRHFRVTLIMVYGGSQPAPYLDIMFQVGEACCARG